MGEQSGRFRAPGASLHSEALTLECGRECLGTGDCGPARHVEAGRWEPLGADCPGLARATTPEPPPHQHGWVRLGLEASRFPHSWGGRPGQCPGPLGCGASGPLAPLFFLHILQQKSLHWALGTEWITESPRAVFKGPIGLGAATTTSSLSFHFASLSEGNPTAHMPPTGPGGNQADSGLLPRCTRAPLA